MAVVIEPAGTHGRPRVVACLFGVDAHETARVLTEQRVRTRAVRGEEIEVAVIVEIDPARLARRAAGSDGGEVLADEAAAALIAEKKVGLGRSEENTSELQSLMSKA